MNRPLLHKKHKHAVRAYRLRNCSALTSQAKGNTKQFDSIEPGSSMVKGNIIRAIKTVQELKYYST